MDFKAIILVYCGSNSKVQITITFSCGFRWRMHRVALYILSNCTETEGSTGNYQLYFFLFNIFVQNCKQDTKRCTIMTACCYTINTELAKFIMLISPTPHNHGWLLSIKSLTQSFLT